MSDKVCLSNAELELTQRIQMHFPRGVIPAEVLAQWNSCPKEILTARLAETFSNPPVPEASKVKSMLYFFGTVTIIPATAATFVARDRFIVNVEQKAKVKIAYLSDDFCKWFLDKIEEPIAGGTLLYHRLRKGLAQGPLIVALGGEAKVEVTLTEVYALMSKQANGEQGVLLTRGYANFFYVRDFSGVLRVVYCSWCGGGWDVFAGSIELPNGWFDGNQVFFRDA